MKKDRIITIFTANVIKDYIKPPHVKNVYVGGKKQKILQTRKQSEDNVIRNIRNLIKSKNKNDAIYDIGIGKY